MRESEYWLNKIGIGLLLLGVAFLFKYSIDQGWTTPAVRVGIGLVIGVSLLAIGLRIHRRRRHFSQVLLGGSMATFYACGFAAYQLFALISHPSAMGLMVLVTVLAFVLSLRQNEALLSVIGAAGGLGTPFLLYTDTGSVPGLVTYTCLLLTGASAVYFYRGWRSLLWVYTLGGWLVFLTAMLKGIPAGPEGALGDRWALQFGVVFGWLAFGVLPTIREAACAAHPTRWVRAPSGAAAGIFEGKQMNLLVRHVHLASISAPLICLAMSMNIWSLPSNQMWGWVSTGGCAFYALGGRILSRWQGVRDLARTHVLAALLLLSTALCLLLDGDVLLFSLAAEAMVLHFVARRLFDEVIRVFAHLLFGVVGSWLGVRVFLGAVESTGILSATALTDLWVVATALVVARAYGNLQRIIYLLAAHAAFAGWLVRELDGNVLFVALTAEATVLRLIAHRLKDRAVAVASHIFFGGLGAWLGFRLIVHNGAGTPVFNAPALADGLLVLTALAGSALAASSQEKLAYRLGAHMAVLAWLLREFSALSSGQAYVTIAWGVYAIILLVIGLRLNRDRLSATAIGTLLLVVGKLFLVDLVMLEAIWRILLFLGFGGGFLVISYYFQNLWRVKTETPS